jgi:hypothetical protein
VGSGPGSFGASVAAADDEDVECLAHRQTGQYTGKGWANSAEGKLAGDPVVMFAAIPSAQKVHLIKHKILF